MAISVSGDSFPMDPGSKPTIPRATSSESIQPLPSSVTSTLVVSAGQILASGDHSTSKALSKLPGFTQTLWSNPWVKTAVIVTVVAIAVGLIAATGGMGLLASIPVLGAVLASSAVTVAGFTASIGLTAAVSSLAVAVTSLATAAIFMRRIEILDRETSGFRDPFKGCETPKQFEARAKEIKAFHQYFDKEAIKMQFIDKFSTSQTFGNDREIKAKIEAVAKHLDVAPIADALKAIYQFSGHFKMTESEYKDYLRILDTYCSEDRSNPDPLPEEIRKKLELLFYDRILPTSRPIEFTQTEIGRELDKIAGDAESKEYVRSQLTQFAGEFRSMTLMAEDGTKRFPHYCVGNRVFIDESILGVHNGGSEVRACDEFIDKMADQFHRQVIGNDSTAAFTIDDAKEAIKNLIPYIRFGQSPGSMIEQTLNLTLRLPDDAPSESLQYSPLTQPSGGELGGEIDTTTLVEDRIPIRVLRSRDDFSNMIFQIQIDPIDKQLKIIRVGKLRLTDMTLGTGESLDLEQVYQTRLEETYTFGNINFSGRPVESRVTYQIERKSKAQHQAELAAEDYVQGEGFTRVDDKMRRE